MRASSVHRAAICPGSDNLEKGLPEDDSDDAREGTLLHSYAADKKLVRSFLKPEQRELLKIADELESRLFAMVESQFSISSDEPLEEGTEKELWVSREISGHCDRWRHYPSKKVVAILDHKFGRKIVAHAAVNLQLRTYTVGAADEWSEAENFIVAIGQPRLPFPDRCTIAHYDRKDIEDAREQLLSILDACRAEDAPLNPGETQCQYCRARLVCPALRAEMEKSAALVPVGAGTVAKRKADVEEIIARCSDEDLDRVIQMCRLAEFVKEKAIDEGRSRVEAGKLPMYQLGKASEPRYIADPAKAEALLALRGIFDRKTIWDCSSMALGKLEDALARRNSNMTMKEARKAIESALGDVIQREQRKPSLIRKN